MDKKSPIDPAQVKALRFIYFDLGWTLIDELPAMRVRAQLTSERFAKLGLRVGGEEFLDRCRACGCRDANSPYHAALREWMTAHGLEDRAAVTVAYDHTFESLFEGVPAMLRELAGRYRLGVIANQSAGTEERLREFGIREHFEVVLSSAEFGRSKPDPEIFAEAERRAGCSGEELAMVGDRLDNDIRPARARGWRTVRVRQGFARDQVPADASAQASIEVNGITEVSEALAAITATPEVAPCR